MCICVKTAVGGGNLLSCFVCRVCYVACAPDFVLLLFDCVFCFTLLFDVRIVSWGRFLFRLLMLNVGSILHLLISSGCCLFYVAFVCLCFVCFLFLF